MKKSYWLGLDRVSFEMTLDDRTKMWHLDKLLPKEALHGGVPGSVLLSKLRPHLPIPEFFLAATQINFPCSLNYICSQPAPSIIFGLLPE